MINAFVRKLSGLADLAEDDVATLIASTSQVRQFAARRDLIREGDRPGPVFVVLSGWACRYKILPSGSRQVTSFMLPGDSCDLHIGILDEMDHSIQTITKASIATIPRTVMEDMLDRSPAIGRALYAAQLIDEATLRAWIVSMGRRSSVERVAHLMCELYLRLQGLTGMVSASVELPVSQLLLADALGMTPVHINRVLRGLREAGVMEISRRSLRITDPAGLVQVAGFDENYLHRRLKTIKSIY
jgi:CRP-like cAMP-binding protein